MSGLQATGLFDFTDYGALVGLLRDTLLVGGLLGVLGGLMSVFVVARDLPFAVHGVSEMSFAGAAGGLLVSGNVVAGSFVGALLTALAIAVLGVRAKDHNSLLGVLMPFGLGLGILFLALYHGRAANKFGLLTGQIVAIDTQSLTVMTVVSLGVIGCLALIWRPLMFSSVDPDVASASGVPTRVLGIAFMLLLGLSVAVAVQLIGALLVLALVCVPAAAAGHVTASPFWLPVLAVVFGVTSVVGGTLIAIGTTVPISPFVTTIAFLIYVSCRGAGSLRDVPRRRAGARTPVAEEVSVA